jgi:TRAP-type mannitol/chloroaromatic compound transport system permease large subunit
MVEFLTAHLAPIMFGCLFLFLLLGYPIAFSLGALGLVFAIIGIQLDMFSWKFMQALPERIFGIMRNDTLLAIPFFTLMGFIFDRSGMAEELLETIGRLFGSVRGGIAYAVIFVGAILGGPAGVATVISMAMISLPVMLRNGYDRRLATGTIAASGTLAQIIPPSIVLVVLGDVMGKSVGDLYLGAWIPSLVLVGLYMLYVLLVTLVKPEWAPALPKESRIVRVPIGLMRALIDHLPGIAIAIGVVMAWKHVPLGKPAATLLATAAGCVWVYWIARRDGISFREALGRSSSGTFYIALAVGIELLEIGMTQLVAGKAFLSLPPSAWVAFGLAFIALPLVFLQAYLGSDEHSKVMAAMAPQLVLLFLVLGTILLGMATATEAGAMGAAGALVMAMMRGKVSWKLLGEAVDETTKLSCFVIFVLIGATVFGLTFRGIDGDRWVEHLFATLPGGQVGFLIVVNLMVFILAFFLDFFEIAFIIVPLLAPVADKMGIDLIWFGVILAINMQTSFMHPPFGFALMYLRSVAPTEPYKDRQTGLMVEGVTTPQIYWGAVPYVIIQLIMVGLVIAFPGMVMHYKG